MTDQDTPTTETTPETGAPADPATATAPPPDAATATAPPADAETTMSEGTTESTPPKELPSIAESKAKKGGYIWGTGRRKASVARVRIKDGEGKFIVNKKEVDVYFCVDEHRHTVRAPLLATEVGKAFDVFVNVNGGGITGQAGAISLGLARALAQLDPALDAKLREKQLLSRDPRRVERKKYGQPGARKRFQFSKR